MNQPLASYIKVYFRQITPSTPSPRCVIDNFRYTRNALNHNRYTRIYLKNHQIFSSLHRDVSKTGYRHYHHHHAFDLSILNNATPAVKKYFRIYLIFYELKKFYILHLLSQGYPNLYIYILIYRVIKEESALLWDMIVWVILRKKVHTNMGPILNGYGVMTAWNLK